MRAISRRARPHTITVYNYTGSTNGVAAYQRTVVGLVAFDKAYQQRLSQRGVATSDVAQLIMELSDYTATAERTFVEPTAWHALTTEQQALHFTFRPADDFFVEGDAPETLPNSTKNTMQAKYRCYGISSCAVPLCGQADPGTVEVTAK